MPAGSLVANAYGLFDIRTTMLGMVAIGMAIIPHRHRPIQVHHWVDPREPRR